MTSGMHLPIFAVKNGLEGVPSSKIFHLTSSYLTGEVHSLLLPLKVGSLSAHQPPLIPWSVP